MFFDELLSLLKDNKRFPYYAAERRIDLFINVFLEQILTQYYGEKVNFVAPEFPLKLDSNNQADKLDYLCAFDDTKQPIFVELKTDSISFKEAQASMYVERAARWPDCIERLRDIICEGRMRFSYRIKYYYLIKRLYETGLIDLPESVIWDSFMSEPQTQKDKMQFSRYFMSLCNEMRPKWPNESRLLYLIPANKELKMLFEKPMDFKIDVLDFEDIRKQSIGPGMNHASEFQKLATLLSEFQ